MMACVRLNQTNDDRQHWLHMLSRARPGDIIPRGLLDSLITVHEAREALGERMALRPCPDGLQVVKASPRDCRDCLQLERTCDRCASEHEAISRGRLRP